MEIQIKNTLLNLPNKIYLDQLMKLNIGKIQKISKLLEELDKQSKEPELEELIPILEWFTTFFTVLGVKHRFDLPEFMLFIRHDQFVPWFKGLFGNF